MPIHYERDDKRRRILAISEGHVTADETLAIINRQAADGAWAYQLLFDTRGTEALPTVEELLRVVRRVGVLTTKYGPRGAVALVVINPALAQIGARYARMADLTAVSVKLFPSLHEAEEWLDELDR